MHLYIYLVYLDAFIYLFSVLKLISYRGGKGHGEITFVISDETLVGATI